MTGKLIYNPQPIAFTHGSGIYLTDTQGKTYLDALSGIAVCGLGHAHPDVTATIQQQAAKLLHTSNVYQIQNQEILAEKICALTKMEQVFFCNSGCEANEAAIKLSRLHAREKNIAEPKIIVMEGAFHGRTMATLTATASQKVRAGYEPLLPGFIRVPFNDVEAIRALAKQDPHIVAILVEPIQGEGGIIVANNGYLTQLRELCDAHDWLLMIDEIQTGNARTGAWFMCDHENVLADVLTTAKGLGNGIPIGACLMRGRAAGLFKPGMHGSTFGGNPFATAVASTVIDVIEKNNLIENAKNIGHYLKQRLECEIGILEGIVEIRGQGLMLGIELNRPCLDVVRHGLNHGLLFNVTQERVIRLLPPLIINKHDADEIVMRLRAALNDFLTIAH